MTTTMWTCGGMTLCDTHALAETNVVLRAVGLAPARTMAEAVTVVELHLALAGDTAPIIEATRPGGCELCET